MKHVTKFLAAPAAGTLLAFANTAWAQTEVDVSASVGVANMYYWRGMDLGQGDPAVSADLSVSAGGAYGGIWGSSGDAELGTEYDLYAGYGRSFGDFSVDVSAWTYVYPSAVESDPGDLSEVVVSAGWGPIAVSYLENVAGDSGYWYGTVGATFDAFSVTYGQHEDDYAHVDLSYAYNDNLSFTLGIPVDDVDGTRDDDPLFVASYTLPIE